MQFSTIPGVLVIGIGHKAQHGKTSVAREWLQAHPADAMIFELSDHVATVARIFHGMTTRDPATLVRVGQGMRATFDDEVWLRCVHGSIGDKRPAIAIIPNIRFPNEVEFVRQIGGYIVKVERVNYTGTSAPTPFVSSDRDPRAITETALDGFDGWDHVITNYGTSHLPINAAKVLADILRKARR